MYLNMLLCVLTHRLHIYSYVLFSTSAINEDKYGVQVPYGSSHPYWIPLSWFSFTLYVSKYHVHHDDALPGGVFCDSPLDFVIQFHNNLDSFLVILFGHLIKTHFNGFVAFWSNSSNNYSLCCGITHL